MKCLTVRRSMRHKPYQWENRDRPHQAQENPHRGLLRHAGGHPAGGQKGTDAQ